VPRFGNDLHEDREAGAVKETSQDARLVVLCAHVSGVTADWPHEVTIRHKRGHTGESVRIGIGKIHERV
jgi:hypothetical protein